jgi:Flp pilus assembly protein TadG
VDRRQGQAAVEFALVVLLFVGMVLAVIEGARLGVMYFTVGNAARDGARAGAFVGATNPTVVARVNQASGAFLGDYASAVGASTCPANSVCVCRHQTPTAAVTAACDTTVPSGGVIDVTVTRTFTFIPFGNTSTGIFARASVPLTGYYRARVE